MTVQLPCMHVSESIAILLFTGILGSFSRTAAGVPLCISGMFRWAPSIKRLPSGSVRRQYRPIQLVRSFAPALAHIGHHPPSLAL